MIFEVQLENTVTVDSHHFRFVGAHKPLRFVEIFSGGIFGIIELVQGSMCGFKPFRRGWKTVSESVQCPKIILIDIR